MLISDLITHSIQETRPNNDNWKIILHKLLSEYISDTRPSIEGHLINHMNESLESDPNNYSNNVTSQTKCE